MLIMLVPENDFETVSRAKEVAPMNIDFAGILTYLVGVYLVNILTLVSRASAFEDNAE